MSEKATMVSSSNSHLIGTFSRRLYCRYGQFDGCDDADNVGKNQLPQERPPGSEDLFDNSHLSQSEQRPPGSEDLFDNSHIHSSPTKAPSSSSHDDAPQTPPSSAGSSITLTFDENGILQNYQVKTKSTAKTLIPIFVTPIALALVLCLAFLWRKYQTNRDQRRIEDVQVAVLEAGVRQQEQRRKILLQELKNEKICMVVRSRDIHPLPLDPQGQQGTRPPMVNDVDADSNADRTSCDNDIQRVVGIELGERVVVDEGDRAEENQQDKDYVSSDRMSENGQQQEPEVVKSTSTIGIADDQATTTAVDENNKHDIENPPNHDSPESLLLLPCERQVPNLCAICLELYQQGDTVVWSNNCTHAFHQHCLVTSLSLRENCSHLPCPSCRQDFLVLKQQFQKTQ